MVAKMISWILEFQTLLKYLSLAPKNVIQVKQNSISETTQSRSLS